jgi:hypothetical protein
MTPRALRLLVALTFLVAPLTAETQPQATRARIAVLALSSAPPAVAFSAGVTAFQQYLRELGGSRART